MNKRGGGADNMGNAVVIGGGDVGVGGGRAKQRYCCRLPEVLGELLEDLSYNLPFLFDVNHVFLVDLEGNGG